MRLVVIAVASTCACTFAPPALVDGTPDVPDVPADAVPGVTCPADPALRVCLTFDVDPLPASLANEGTAAVAAELSNVTRIAHDDGGAALVDTASQMRIPPNRETIGLATVEAWLRVDADPPAGSRVGIVDANPTSSACSLFYYNAVANRQVRFELGQAYYVDATLGLGEWHHLAQVCDQGMLFAYIDGVAVGQFTGCTPGDGTTFGLQLAANNTGEVGDQNLVGAIDAIRMWTVPLTAAQICEHAGRPDC